MVLGGTEHHWSRRKAIARIFVEIVFVRFFSVKCLYALAVRGIPHASKDRWRYPFLVMERNYIWNEGAIAQLTSTQSDQ
ncbi:MAG: hypothetical protein CMJ78_15295 [Planctomycetaceae bacterium]|nr:hypothetical protein [Planctomycetaceae bacterium]